MAVGWGWGDCGLFIYFGCTGSSLRAWAFSSCREWRLLLVVLHRLLIVVASFVAEHRL